MPEVPTSSGERDETVGDPDAGRVSGRGAADATADGPVERLGAWIGRLGSASKTRAAIVLTVCLLLGVGGFLIGKRIKVNTDLKALLPQDAPSLVASREFGERKGTTDRLVVAIESSDPEANVRMANDLAAQLATWEDMSAVTADRDYTPLRDHALYYLEQEDLERLRDELVTERRKAVFRAQKLNLDGNEGDGGDDEGFEHAVVEDDWDAEPSWDDEPTLPEDEPPAGDVGADAEPGADGADGADEDERDVEDLREWLDEQRQAFIDQGRLRPEEVDLVWPKENEAGELVWEDRVAQPLKNPEGTVVLVQAVPDRPPTDVAYARDIGQRVDAAVQELGPASYAEDLRVQVVGGYDVTGDVNVILEDMRNATIVSGVLVALVLIGGFLSPRGLILVVSSVAVSLMVTLGLTELVYGELNSLTAFIFAVLFGMGVDFSVHMYAQREAQGAAADWPAVIREHLRPLGSAMLTTVAGLWVLGLAEFKGFREFGLISGVGVLLCLVFALLMVPALDTLMGDRRWVRSTGRLDPAESEAPVEPDRKGGGSVLGWVKWGILAGCLVVAGIGLPDVEFETDLRTLRPPKKKSDKISYGSAVGKNRDSVPAVIFSDEPGELDRAVAALEALEAPPGVEGDAARPYLVKDVVSLMAVMPEGQGDKGPVLEEIAEAAETFLAELPDLREDDESRQYETHLEALERLAGSDELEPEELPDWAREAFTENDGQTGRIGHAYLRYSRSDLNDVQRAFEELKAALDGIEVSVANTSFIYVDLTYSVGRDSARIPPIAMLVILLVIGLDMRHLVGSLAVFGTLVLGLGLTFGLMGLLDLHLNFFNLVVVPAVVGLGIDASIHLWHARARGRLGATGKASLIAAMTTVAAFAGLWVAQHPGLRSIAHVGVLAIVCCVTVAFVALALGARQRGTGE